MESAKKKLSTTRRPTSRSKKPTQFRIPIFITKLLKLLQDKSTINVIHWEDVGDHGTVTILDKGRLEVEILPRYFKHTKCSSFLRQLNSHGFKKASRRSPNDTEAAMVYVNNQFMRSKQDQYHMVKRKKRMNGERVETSCSNHMVNSIADLQNSLILMDVDPNYYLVRLLTSPLYCKGIGTVVRKLAAGEINDDDSYRGLLSLNSPDHKKDRKDTQIVSLIKKYLNELRYAMNMKDKLNDRKNIELINEKLESQADVLTDDAETQSFLSGSRLEENSLKPDNIITSQMFQEEIYPYSCKEFCSSTNRFENMFELHY